MRPIATVQNAETVSTCTPSTTKRSLRIVDLHVRRHRRSFSAIPIRRFNWRKTAKRSAPGLQVGRYESSTKHASHDTHFSQFSEKNTFCCNCVRLSDATLTAVRQASASRHVPVMWRRWARLLLGLPAEAQCHPHPADSAHVASPRFPHRETPTRFAAAPSCTSLLPRRSAMPPRQLPPRCIPHVPRTPPGQ